MIIEKFGRKGTPKINRVCGTIIGGALVTSIVIVGNNSNSVKVDWNFDNSSVVALQNSKEKYIYSYQTTSSPNVLNISKDDYFKYVNRNCCEVSNEKLDNIRKIKEISLLENNWNANGAHSFENGFLNNISNLLLFLNVQPEIFPTACDTLQFEYDRDDGAHLEIEIDKEMMAEVYRVEADGAEVESYIKATSEDINRVVDQFYG